MKTNIYTFMVMVTEDGKKGCVLTENKIRQVTDNELNNITWRDVKEGGIGYTVQCSFDSMSANTPVIETGMTLDQFVRQI